MTSRREQLLDEMRALMKETAIADLTEDEITDQILFLLRVRRRVDGAAQPRRLHSVGAQ